MEEEKSEKKQYPKTKRLFYIGVLAVAIAGAGIIGYNYFNSEDLNRPNQAKPIQPIEQPEKEIGFIKLKKIQAKYPDGEHLEELRHKETRLRLELKNAMKPVIITPPKVEEKPFDDSVWQKNAQTIISEVAELENRKKKAAEEYKKETEEEYLKKRDKINEQFLNEILNINLKLQNADNMRLESAEVEQLQQRLHELKKQRGETQKELFDQWVAEIANHAEESIKDDDLKLRVQAQESMNKVKEEAQRTRLEAEERNKAIMEQAMKESELRQDQRRRLMEELQETVRVRTELENKITDEIGDELSKLAYIHKLKLVLVSREMEDSEKFLPFEFDEGVNFSSAMEKLKSPVNGAVILSSSNAVDLTDELIREMERQALFTSKK